MARVLSYLVFIGGPIVLWVLWAARSTGLFSRGIPLGIREKAILEKYAVQYQRLSPAAQHVFEQKVAHFVVEKQWVGVGITVALEMKVMIAACAAQLLQGFPELELRHFTRIAVYPKAYRSHLTDRVHQVEVRPVTGLIIISWEDFLRGYAHRHDAHNVGLHEMAHALWFENGIINGEDHFFDAVVLARWKGLTVEETSRIRRGKESPLRDYAGTNEAEFFAVAVEYFFERPKAFKETSPALFDCLSELLRTDPSAPPVP